MGNESVVLWLSVELARGYFVAVVVGMAGLLQVVAARWSQERLRWLPRSLAAPLGVVAMVGAATWFYLAFYSLIFVPGPAGLELILLFAVATVLAVWLTKALHALVVWQRGNAAEGERERGREGEKGS